MRKRSRNISSLNKKKGWDIGVSIAENIGSLKIEIKIINYKIIE